MQKKLYGLIGWPLKHSFSANYFTEKFKELNLPGHSYKLFPMEHLMQLPELVLRKPELQGLNVTIPHKEDVLNILDELDPEAAAVGAVNCIKIRQTKGDLLLKGYNTDIYGFEKSVSEQCDLKQIKQALIIGNGGASKAAQYVLRKYQVPYYIVSRNNDDPDQPMVSYEDLTDEYISITDLVIQTTPLGMWPDKENFPMINYTVLPSSCHCFDMIYNPPQTEFMKRCEKQGCTVQNGLDMLRYQADRSWEIWQR